MPSIRQSVGRSPVLHPSVTQEAIDTAAKNNSSHCMTADSIRAQYPKYTYISVDMQTIRLSDPEKGLRYIYLTPRLVQQSIVLWDEGKRIRPFKFSLRGAHIVAMAQINRGKGQSVRKRLSLGRRKIVPHGTNKLPDVVGGKAPVRAKHPTSATARTFGLRAFTRGDLEDVGFK